MRRRETAIGARRRNATASRGHTINPCKVGCLWEGSWGQISRSRWRPFLLHGGGLHDIRMGPSGRLELGTRFFRSFKYRRWTSAHFLTIHSISSAALISGNIIYSEFKNSTQNAIPANSSQESFSWSFEQKANHTAACAIAQINLKTGGAD